MKHVEQLRELNACKDAIEWAKTQPDWDSCWRECPRGDWLLWTPGLDHKQSVLAACECARTALHLVPNGEKRPRIAIETAEAWARGEATGEEVSAAYAGAAVAASYAATFAAYAATDYATADAADAAASAAADAAYAATDANADAADAAYAAADADAYSSPYARARAHRECADIVRRHFPNAPELLEVVS